MQRPVRLPGQPARRPLLPVCAICFALSGCGRAPTFNILGSFFPAWLLCIVAGIIFAAVARLLLIRWKIHGELLWPILVYPCLAATFAFTVWLLFFS